MVLWLGSSLHSMNSRFERSGETRKLGRGNAVVFSSFIAVGQIPTNNGSATVMLTNAFLTVVRNIGFRYRKMLR